MAWDSMRGRDLTRGAGLERLVCQEDSEAEKLMGRKTLSTATPGEAQMLKFKKIKTGLEKIHCEIFGPLAGRGRRGGRVRPEWGRRSQALSLW